jgi:hypothetical protein
MQTIKPTLVTSKEIQDLIIQNEPLLQISTSRNMKDAKGKQFLENLKHLTVTQSLLLGNMYICFFFIKK